MNHQGPQMQARATAARLCATVVLALAVIGISYNAISETAHGQALRGREFHVSPSGAPGNDGSLQRPLDLTTALSKNSPARAGDTIWLHHGTYRGSFSSYLTGTEAAPIVVRQYPGERATIDSGSTAADAMGIGGAHTWYWGFEITSSDPKRISAQSGSWPTDLRRGYGAFVKGPGTKFINLIVHDNANGLGLWTEAAGAEAYGNIVYFNGWDAPDRAHGHGIYTQNASGLRLLAENILFHQFSHGIHAYGSDAAALDNITLDGNISFMNGAVSRGGIWNSGRDLLLGGSRVATNPVMSNNATYGGQTNLGYGGGCVNGRMVNNYLMGPVQIVRCVPLMTGNSLYDASWPKYGTWPTQFPQNTFYTTAPTGTVVRIRPNKYEAGRAHVAVYNWGRASVVPVDITAAQLPLGAAFEIRDAQDYFGRPVVSGTYDGRPVNLVMSGLRAAAPVGNVPVVPPHTAPTFAAFVVVPSATVPPAPTTPDPAVSLSLSSSSIQPGQSATLSWSATNASSLTIDQGIGTVALSGSRQITPSATTTFTAVAVNTAGVRKTSSVTLSVTGTVPPTPPPPAPPADPGGVTVQMTSPVHNSWVANQSTVTVAANVNDPAGEVTRVEFYRGPTNIGTAFRKPYSLQWTHVTVGTYSITARVYNKMGVIATSVPTVLNVSPPK